MKKLPTFLLCLIFSVVWSNTYTVQKGDTLWGIARSHQVKVSDLYAWNQIDGSVIREGQKIVVNGDSASLSTSASAAKKVATKYVVQKGDTLSRIAAQFGTKLSALCSINNISPREIIRIGQKLIIPDSSYVGSSSFKKRSTLVILDPGHGGSDSGSSNWGVHEKNLNLSIAYKVKSILQSRGFRVLMTRYSDRTVSLSQRVRYSHKYPGAIFVSIHNNSDPAAKATGIETFYYTAKSRTLGYRLQRDLIKATGGVNRKLKHHGYRVLVQNNRAVLVECGFMTSWYELKKLKSSSYQNTLAQSIASTISNNYK